MAAFMSTCMVNCTPPRKSRPRNIGFSLGGLAIHSGLSAKRLSAADVAFTQLVFSITSRALSWVSASLKRHFERIVGDKHAVGGDVGGLQGGGNAVRFAR